MTTITLNAKLLVIKKNPVIVYPWHKHENMEHARRIENLILDWCKKNVRKLKERREYHMSAVWNPEENKISKISIYDTLDNWSVLSSLNLIRLETEKKTAPSELTSSSSHQKIECAAKT